MQSAYKQRHQPNTQNIQSYQRQLSQKPWQRSQNARSQLSPQLKIYNRNVYLRQAYKQMLDSNHEKQIKQLANSQKLNSSSYLILRTKNQLEIQTIVDSMCRNNQEGFQQRLTYEQMCECIFRLNQYLRKAQTLIDVQQLLSQLWLYLKNYEVQTEHLDKNVFQTFMKIIMDPKGIKPKQIKELLSLTDLFKDPEQKKSEFLQQFPELQEQALQDVQIFKLWYSVKQKYNLFPKSFQNSHLQQRKSRYNNQCTFKPEINEMSRVYAEKSLKKYLSSNKLTHQKNMNLRSSNEEQNQLKQYLSHKIMQTGNQDEQNGFSYHDLLHKRKLQKQSISRKIHFQSEEYQSVQTSRRATPLQVKEIVDKMYFVPEKRQNVDYQSKKEEQQLKVCTFNPMTTDYDHSKKYNAAVNGFQKQVNRLKKGRQEKQKLKQIYQNLGKPKNVKCNHSRTPSFIQRDTPKLILEVNIGGGKVQKIKLVGNEDAKIVAKKFIHKHNLESSMLSVLEELIDQNLRNI